MALKEIICDNCGKSSLKEAGGVNRTIRNGGNLYCSRKCTGIARRTTKEEKIEGKRLYDLEYRKREGWHETLRRCVWGYRRLSARATNALRDITHDEEVLIHLLREVVRQAARESAELILSGNG